jgi:hypothetical protein
MSLAGFPASDDLAPNLIRGLPGRKPLQIIGG